MLAASWPVVALKAAASCATMEKVPRSAGEPVGAGSEIRCVELDPDTRTGNALLGSLRYQGERGFALMSRRWPTLQRVMLSPSRIGDIARAALVLVQSGHTVIS